MNDKPPIWRAAVVCYILGFVCVVGQAGVIVIHHVAVCELLILREHGCGTPHDAPPIVRFFNRCSASRVLLTRGTGVEAGLAPICRCASASR